MRDIEGYEGLYAVTSCGKVWSYRSKRFLTPRINNKGYLRVALSKSGETKDFYIHRLVATAFIPNEGNKPEVNHLDENPLNNACNNLQWVTHAENMRYGTAPKRIGEARQKPVYCIETKQVYESAVKAAEELSTWPQSVSESCLSNGRRMASGYHFIFYSPALGDSEKVS